MYRRLIPTILAAALLLAACSSSSTQAPTSAPAGQAEPTQASQAVSLASIPGCTAESPEPTPGPTETALFPPISDEDWSQGEKTASIQIIEYSDFQ